MPKPREKPTASEILKVLDGLWVDKKGITIIAYCGDNRAWEHMKNIKENIKLNYGKECPRDYVPTDEVIKYFDINLNYLKKVCMKESTK